MPTYIVAYDLIPNAIKHAEVIKRLRKIGGEIPIELLVEQVSRNPDSTFVIDSELSAVAILDVLREPGGIDSTDKVLIAAVAGTILRHL